MGPGAAPNRPMSPVSLCWRRGKKHASNIRVSAADLMAAPCRPGDAFRSVSDSRAEDFAGNVFRTPALDLAALAACIATCTRWNLCAVSCDSNQAGSYYQLANCMFYLHGVLSLCTEPQSPRATCKIPGSSASSISRPSRLSRAATSILHALCFTLYIYFRKHSLRFRLV